MSREMLIQMLVIDCLDHAGDIGRYRWLARALENGFCGFANMNERELREEARVRRLNTEPIPVVDDGECESDDDVNQLLSLYSAETRRFDLL